MKTGQSKKLRLEIEAHAVAGLYRDHFSLVENVCKTGSLIFGSKVKDFGFPSSLFT